MLLLVELQLLERNDVPSLFVSCPEDYTVRPFLDRVESLVAVY